MIVEIESGPISCRTAPSLIGAGLGVALPATILVGAMLGVAVPTTILSVSEANAQTIGMERRQERRQEDCKI